MDVEADELLLDLLLLVEYGVYHEVLAGTVYVSQDVVVKADLDGVAVHFGHSKSVTVVLKVLVLVT